MQLQPNELYLKVSIDRVFEMKVFLDKTNLTDKVQTNTKDNFLYIQSIKPVEWKYIAFFATLFSNLIDSFKPNEGMLFFSNDYELIGHGVYELPNFKDD